MFRFLKNRRQYYRNNDQKIFPLVLFASSAVASLLSLFIGLRQSVWFDEAYSIMLAKRPVGELIALTAADTHPPLYYLLLKAWATVFGYSDVALRSLSICALFGAIFVMGLLLKKMFGARIAIASLLLLMVAPMLLRYGYEIRMYSLASFIGVAATYALYAAIRSNSSRRIMLLIVYGVLIAAGMYTLYYLAFLWIAHIVWLVWMFAKEKRKEMFLQRFAAVYVGAFIIFLPWLMTFVHQIGNGALAPIAQPMNLENIAGIVTFNTLYLPVWQINVIGSVLMIVLFIGIGMLVRFAYKQQYKRDELMLLATYTLVPVSILIVISLFRNMYVERYLAHVAIGYVALLGVLMAFALSNTSFKKTTASAIAATLYGTTIIGCITAAAVGNFNFQRLQTPNIHSVASQISECEQTQVVAADPYVAIELDYYLPKCNVYFVSPYDSLSGGYAPLSGSPLQLRDLSDISMQNIIYVYYGDMPQVPAGYVQTENSSDGPMKIARLSAE